MSKCIDIIVNRHDEPWETGKKFFDMLAYQRCVSPDEYTVTLVQNGRQYALDWQTLLSQYPFPVRIATIDEAPNAVARNAGLMNTSSDWIMFCDFDDMFGDLSALRMICDQFPVTDYDLIWMKCASEEKWRAGDVYINCIEHIVATNVVGKLYRRAFLKENNIRFDPSVPCYSDYMFNATVCAITQPYRIVQLTTNFYPYFKTFRDDSFTNSVNNLHQFITSRFDRDVALANAFRKRGMDYDYRKALMSVICSEYYRIYQPDSSDSKDIASPRFMQFWEENKNVISSFTQTEIEVMKDVAETETMSMIQHFYNNHKSEFYFVNDTITFKQWLSMLATFTPAQQDPPAPPTHPAPPEKDTSQVVVSNNPIIVSKDDYTTTPSREPHVAVYCGTYNTYLNMMTAAKSLIWNTPVDKVYFIIEDDTFPYPLPDIIECINVKDQQWFQPTGPNYNNAWSYMCMMRAAFTKLIPYKKVLSFDIDTVVQENISSLWDLDLSNYYLAGVLEPQRQHSASDPYYINFGVVMMNLDKLRTDHVDDTIITALNTDRFGCPEQDAFNRFCAFHILPIPNDYNATIYSHITGEAQKERIIHYAGIQYWRHYGNVKEYADRSWDIIMQHQTELRKQVK